MSKLESLFIVICLVVILTLVTLIIESKEPTNQKVCTQEAMQCPDGSYVVRVPPDCNFQQCSSTATTIHSTTTIPNFVTTTTPVYETQAKITSVSIHGRCAPKSGTYGCCQCTVWENGVDLQGSNSFASGSAGDEIDFFVNLQGHGNVKIVFTIWLSTQDVFPETSPFVYNATHTIFLDGTNQTDKFIVRSCLRPCSDPADIKLQATGLHSAYFRVYNANTNVLLYDSGLIKHPLDVF